MKIKKLGHCCLVIEVNGKRVMTDPGSYTASQNEERNISAVLVTHEHADHLHIDSLKKILGVNPDAIVITNTSVGKLLDEEGIKSSWANTSNDNIRLLVYGLANVKYFLTKIHLKNPKHLNKLKELV